MWKLIRIMFLDIIFVTILYIVSYTNCDSNAILQVQHLSQFFLNTRSTTYDFTQIISINDYWKWLQTSFVSNIHVQSWYNGDLTENLTDYINDKSSRIIGWATMRQLRSRLNDSCQIPILLRPLISSCKNSYTLFNDERGSFAPGWVSASNITYSSSIQNAFIYRSSAELDTYIYLGDHGTYGGGGYVYEFRGNFSDLQGNLSLLHKLSWIDKESRAIMIQINLYNPNVKFFTSVTLLIEISVTGEVFSSAHIAPIQMYIELNNFSSIFYFIIALIYIIFISYMTIREIYSIIQMKTKYFHQIHVYIEWGIIVCSWASLGIYFWRYSEINRIEKYFRQTKGFQYINLQRVAYVNDVLTFLLGFCCFFGTIRLLRLLKTYPRINMFVHTLNRAFQDILTFSLMFFLLFFAFVILFYLLFVSKMFSCSSLLQTSGMLFEMLLLAFDFSEIHNADAFLGPFVFILFIYFVVFICITMFITIITYHLRQVRKESHQIEDRYPDVLSFLMRDIIKRIGLKKLTEEDLQEQMDVIMRSKYKNPVEQLPEKVDELFLALYKSCITYTKSELMEISESKEISSISTVNSQH